MYKTLMGYLPYQLVQDFFHQQYLALGVCFEICLKFHLISPRNHGRLFDKRMWMWMLSKTIWYSKAKKTMGVFTPSLTIGCWAAVIRTITRNCTKFDKICTNHWLKDIVSCWIGFLFLVCNLTSLAPLHRPQPIEWYHVYIFMPTPRFTVGKESINFKGNLIITFTIHSEPVFR